MEAENVMKLQVHLLILIGIPVFIGYFLIFLLEWKLAMSQSLGNICVCYFKYNNKAPLENQDFPGRNISFHKAQNWSYCRAPHT